MIRVIQLRSADLGRDARTTADGVGRVADVVILPGRVEDRWPSILRAATTAWRRRRDGDVLLAVGEPALAAASIGWPGHVVYVPGLCPCRRDGRLLNRLGGRVTVVAPDRPLARVLVRHGADPRHMVTIAPPLADGLARPRDELRTSLGVADSERLVLLPGPSGVVGGHRVGLHAAAILHVRDPVVRALVGGHGPMADAMVSLARKAGSRTLLLSAPRWTAAELARAADAAVVCPAGPVDRLPVAAAMRAGLPVVAAASPWLDGLIDATTATVVDPPKARRLAEALLAALEGDGPDRRDAAKARASHVHNPAKFERAWSRALDRAARDVGHG